MSKCPNINFTVAAGSLPVSASGCINGDGTSNNPLTLDLHPDGSIICTSLGLQASVSGGSTFVNVSGCLSGDGSAGNPVILNLHPDGSIICTSSGLQASISGGGGTSYSFSISDGSNTQTVSNGDTVSFVGVGVSALVSGNDQVIYSFTETNTSISGLSDGTIEYIDENSSTTSINICSVIGGCSINSLSDVNATSPTNAQVLTYSGGEWISADAAVGGGGSGDVVGPASSTDNAIARFDSTTGKLIEDSSVTINDTGSMTFLNNREIIIAGSNANVRVGNTTMALQGTQLSLYNGGQILWSSTAIYTQTKDAGISKADEGGLKINNGAPGQDGPLRVKYLTLSNGVEPSASGNVAHLFASGVGTGTELYAQDAAGNSTQISSHNEKGEYAVHYINNLTGKEVEIDIERFFMENFKDYIKLKNKHE